MIEGITQNELLRLIEEMQEFDVNTNTYQKFDQEIKTGLKMIKATKAHLLGGIKNTQDDVEALLAQGKKLQYDDNNPYLKAANAMIQMSNNLMSTLEWGDLQAKLQITHSKKVFGLVERLREMSLELQKIEADKERAISVTKEMTAFFKEEMANFRTMFKDIIAQYMLLKDEVNTLKSMVLNGKPLTTPLKTIPEATPQPINTPEKTPKIESPALVPESQKDELEEDVLQLLKKGIALFSRDIAEKVQGNPETVKLKLDSMVERGLLVRQVKRYKIPRERRVG